MAKVLIVSDNHGGTETLEGIIKREKPFDLMIHCGDVVFDSAEAKLTSMADTPVYVVSGNCDVFSDLSNYVDFEYQGHHILVVHGYYENVNYGTDGLFRKANAVGADIVFFGHTHVPYLAEDSGVIMANPGSTDRPRQSGSESTYMVMDIKNDERPEITLKKYSF